MNSFAGKKSFKKEFESNKREVVWLMGSGRDSKAEGHSNLKEGKAGEEYRGGRS